MASPVWRKRWLAQMVLMHVVKEAIQADVRQALACGLIDKLTFIRLLLLKETD
jgi:hypothetical protein